MSRPATGSQKRSNRRIVILGIVVIVAGILLAGLGFFRMFTSVNDRVNDLARVGPDGGVVHLSAGEQTIYAEYPDASEISRDYQVRISTETREIETWDPNSETHYLFGGREGRSIAKVDIPADGDYRIEPNGARPSRGFAIGGSITDGVGTAVVVLLAGIATVIIGIIILVVTMVRSARNRRVGPPTQPPPGFPRGSSLPPPPSGPPPSTPPWSEPQGPIS